MEVTLPSETPKEKKPPTAAQLAKIQREKNAAERILKETGIKVPPTVGARLLKLEREGGNVQGFLTTIQTTGKGITRKQVTVPPVASVTAVPTIPTIPTVVSTPAVNKPKSVKRAKTVKKNKPRMNALPTGTEEIAVATALKEADASLTDEELKTLSKCEQIHEKLVEKTRKNLRNALGRTAMDDEVQRLVSMRKTGYNLPMEKYLEFIRGLRKVKTLRRGKKNVRNVLPGFTKKQKEGLEAFLNENA